MILILITSAVALLTVAGYSKLLWWFTILDFFRLQYAGTAFLAGIGCLYFGNYWLLIVNIVLIVINIFRIRHFLPRLPHIPKQDANKTLFSINAYKENEKIDKLEAILEKTNPEVILVMEMTEHHEKKMVRIVSQYPYRLQTPVRDGFSISLLSKTILEDTNITYHGPTETPLLEAVVTVKNKKYQIYSAHPKPALNKKWHIDRLNYFSDIQKAMSTKSGKHPIIVMGDFNSVPWEKHFTDFLDAVGLQSTIKDQGYKVTWPVYFPIMGIPMDHILISKGTHYSNVQVGPTVGSDHYPLSLNL